VREKFGDPIDGMRGNAAENILEPGEGINASTLAGSYEAAQHRGGSTADIAAKEQPVGAADCDTADALFGAVVIDFEMAIFGVAGQRGPVLRA